MVTREYTSLEDLYPERSSVDEVYKLILEDLMFASENLPLKWSSAEAGRVTKGTAMAHLSLVYLNMKNWQEAESGLPK